MRFDSYVIAGLNPEPWKAPKQGRNGAYSDPEFTAYKEALREELGLLHGDTPLLEPPYQLRFFWWREIVTYQGANRMVTKQAVDQSNLQKAAEDCLQPHKKSGWTGVITNDRYCQFSGGLIVEQAKEVEPIIAIEIASEVTTTGRIVFPLDMMDHTADLVLHAMQTNATVAIPTNDRT
jgi:hypothetical protein